MKLLILLIVLLLLLLNVLCDDNSINIGSDNDVEDHITLSINDEKSILNSNDHDDNANNVTDSSIDSLNIVNDSITNKNAIGDAIEETDNAVDAISNEHDTIEVAVSKVDVAVEDTLNADAVSTVQDTVTVEDTVTVVAVTIQDASSKIEDTVIPKESSKETVVDTCPPIPECNIDCEQEITFMTLMSQEKEKLEYDLQLMIKANAEKAAKYQQEIDELKLSLASISTKSTNTDDTNALISVLIQYNITDSNELSETLSRYSVLLQANETVTNNIDETTKTNIETTDIKSISFDSINLPRPSSLTTLTECQDTYVSLLKEFTSIQDNLKSTMVKMKLAKNEQSRAVLALEHCKLEAEVDATNNDESLKLFKQRESQLQLKLEESQTENKKLMTSLATTSAKCDQQQSKHEKSTVSQTKDTTVISSVEKTVTEKPVTKTAVAEEVEKNKVSADSEIKSIDNDRDTIKDTTSNVMQFIQLISGAIQNLFLSIWSFLFYTVIPYYQNIILPSIKDWYQETLYPWYLVNVNPWYMENLDVYVKQFMTMSSSFYLKYLQDILFDYIIPVLDFLWMKLNIIFYYVYSYYDDEDLYRRLEAVAYSAIVNVSKWSHIIVANYIQVSEIAIDFLKQQSYLQQLLGTNLVLAAPYIIYTIQIIVALFLRNYILGIGAFIILIIFSPLWLVLFILSKILNIIIFPFRYIRKLFKKKSKKSLKDKKTKNSKNGIYNTKTKQQSQQQLNSSNQGTGVANVYDRLKGQGLPQQQTTGGPFSNANNLSSIDVSIQQIPIYPSDAMNIIRDSLQRDNIDDDV